MTLDEMRADMACRGWYPITCWHLSLRGDPRGAWEVCKHSAARGCDLRVVGMTHYRIRG